MAQNGTRDSSSDSSEDDTSPDNSDVEEDKVVSVFSWHVQMLMLFQRAHFSLSHFVEIILLLFLF